MEFFVRKVNHKTFDCFEGKQYCEATWSRLKAGAKGSVYVDKGVKLPYALVKSLANAINPRLNEQLITVQ